ncbi:hypothetical protein N9X24_02910, partial [Rickettsiales bacterium]|nr:hypothetical protein [Rickettsiales bacterium]
MSLSEYIKTRLLGDQDSLEVKLTQHEKDMMAVSVKSFYLLSSLVDRKKDLNFDNIIKEAEDFLVEKNIKPKKNLINYIIQA